MPALVEVKAGVLKHLERVNSERQTKFRAAAAVGSVAMINITAN